ncbi:hypothetical protein ES705_38935 [subsurface metagenome]
MTNFIGRIEKWTWFGYAPAREEESPYIAKWKYFRAPEGLVMELISINSSFQIEQGECHGIIQLYLGHKRPSKYGLYPHIEDQDVLYRGETSQAYNNVCNESSELHNYEVKQFTIAIRSTTELQEFRPCIIIFYRLKKFQDTHDKLEYAVKQPKLKKSKALGQKEIYTR